MSLFHPNPESGNTLYTLRTSPRSFDDFYPFFWNTKLRRVWMSGVFPRVASLTLIESCCKKNLAPQGIRYLYLGKEFGGFRKGGYVAYMETESFQRGFEKLEEIGRKKSTAFFCAERYTWKCRRRWISGQLIEKGWKVIHIIEKGKIWVPRKMDSNLGNTQA